MGRLNHENNVAVPGYGKPVLLSGDDSFNQVAAQSQVYAYIANDADSMWNDQGKLYAFVPDDAYAAVNDYFDFGVGSTASISGKFIEVPKEIATGKDADGNDVTSADFGYPLPPSDGTWQRGPGITSGPGIDGPRWVLEHWGDMHNAFRSCASRTSPRHATGDVQRRLPGRLWAVAFATINRSQVRPSDRRTAGLEDRARPQRSDDRPIAFGPHRWRRQPGQDGRRDAPAGQPRDDPQGLYITEDPGASQQFDATQQVNDAGRATTARIWQYKFADASLNVVAKVDQSADQGATDVDAAPTAGLPGVHGSPPGSSYVSARVRARRVPRERPGPHAVDRRNRPQRTGRTSAREVSSCWSPFLAAERPRHCGAARPGPTGPASLIPATNRRDS